MEPKTTEFWRNQLPHWEVESGTYFITIRCAGSLPKAVAERVATIHRTLQAIEPASEEFRLLQRQYFLTTEKYLDAAHGFCPFREAHCCDLAVKALQSLDQQGWQVLHYAIMPNHLHALFATTKEANGMKIVWQRWKGSTARAGNEILGRRGAFWQRDWFDRWMRDEAEMQKTIAYIRNNPVKAGLVQKWEDFPWVR